VNGTLTPPSKKKNYQAAVHAQDPETVYNIDHTYLPASRKLVDCILTNKTRRLLRWLDQVTEGKLPVPATDVSLAVVLSWDKFVPMYQQKMAERMKRAKERVEAMREADKEAHLKDEPPFVEEAELMNQLDQLRMDGRLMRAHYKEFKRRWKRFRKEKTRWDQEWSQLSYEKKQSRMGEAISRGQKWKKLVREKRQLEADRRQLLDESRLDRHRVGRQLAVLRGEELPPFLEKGKVAILVIIDNSSREVPAIPVFDSGTSVTGEETATAAKYVLPESTKVVISDNGSQFIGQEFQAFLEAHGVDHLTIYPGRPCTNGTVERFNRTLKEWLRDKSWKNSTELRELIDLFLTYYNEYRPHQALDGLTPMQYKEQKLMGVAEPKLQRPTYRYWWGAGPEAAEVTG